MNKIHKLLKKSVRFGILIGAVMCLMQLGAYAAQNKTAEIVFDSVPVTTNISKWSVSEDASIAEFTEKAGKTGLVRGPGGRNYITLNITDSYWYEEFGGSVKVCVEYFDEGTGKFTLRYNSARYGRWASAEDIVVLTNTGVWKTHTFNIDDIILNNALTARGDLEIATWSQTMGGSESDVVFRSVKIDEVFPKVPVTSLIITGKTGNIFGRDEAVSFSVESKNITDYSLASQIGCTVYASDGNKVKSAINNVTLTADGKYTTQISLPDARYDLYTVAVKVTSEGIIDGVNKSFETTEITQISKAYTALPGEPKNEYFNMCTNLSSKNTEIGTEALAKLGVGAIRGGYHWSDAETVKGELKLTDVFKARIKDLSDNGIAASLVLGYNNSLYNGGNAITKAPSTTEEFNGFANYAGFMAKQLKGQVDKFEIWNEWNNSSFNISDEGVENYVKLLRAAYNAIKSQNANPGATVYGVASALADNSFLRKVLLHGGYDYMDAISVHPYDWSGDFNYDKLINDVNKMKRTISIYGNKPIVFTEMGWNTSTSDSGVTEKEQARYAVQMTAISKAYNLADEIYWYDFQNDGRSENDSESNFGVVNYIYSENPYGAKPAYLSISAMNRFMAGGIEYSSKIEDAERTTMMYSFDRTAQNDKLGILWSDVEGGKRVGLKLGCDRIKAYDLFGNLIKEESKMSGYYEFDLSEDPIYITGEFTAFEEDDKPANIESLEASYDNKKNIITVWGIADVYSRFTLELVKNNTVSESVTVHVKPDGSFYKIMTAPSDGDYEIYAARREADTDGNAGYLKTSLSVLKNTDDIREPVSLESSVTVDTSTRDVTVFGSLSNYEEGDSASVLVVKEGCTDINKDTILYIGDLTLEGDTFSHTFKMPDGCFGKYDVYVGGSFLKSPEKLDVGYGIAKVATVNLAEGDNTYNATVKIKNNNTEEKQAVLFVAQYDGSGSLVAINKKSITVLANTHEAETYQLSVDKNAKTVRCRAYIWESAKAMYPLY